MRLAMKMRRDNAESQGVTMSERETQTSTRRLGVEAWRRKS